MSDHLPDGPPDNPTGRDDLDRAVTPILLGCAIIVIVAAAGFLYLVLRILGYKWT